MTTNNNGFFKEIVFDESSKIGLWKISEGIGMSENCGDKTSLRLLQRSSVRMLIKKLIDPFPPAEIIYDAYGKPSLSGFKGFLSISHSHRLVGVYISSLQEAGIDIQHIRPNINRVAHKFAGEAELEKLTADSATDRIDKLHVIWCVKESIYKLYGKGNLVFKDHIQTDSFTYNNKDTLGARLILNGHTASFTAHYEKFENYIIVYTFYSD